MTERRLPYLGKAQTLFPHPLSQPSSQQKTFAKTGSTFVKFVDSENKTLPPSMAGSPNNAKNKEWNDDSNIGHPFSKIKGLSFAMETEEDEVLDKALLKLDQIFQRKAEKNQRKKLEAANGMDSPHNKYVPNSSNARNMEMIGRISKYKNIKGINAKTKEIRFEERMNMFRHVNTFIDIRQVVKEIGNLEKGTGSNQPSGRGGGESPKKLHIKKLDEASGFMEMSEQVEKSMNKASTPVNQDKQSFRYEGFITQQPMDKSLMLKSSSRTNTLVVPRNYDSSRLGDSGATGQRTQFHRTVKTSEKVKEAHRKLKEQIVDNMGLDTLIAIEKNLQDKKKRREVYRKMKSERMEMREMKKDLNNFDLFNNLVEFLSDKKVEHPEIARDESPEAFYRQLDAKLFIEDNKEEELMDPRRLQQLMKEEEEQNEEDEDPEMRATRSNWEGGFQNEQAEDDEQLRVMQALQAYKNRSDKVISILKRKTNRIHKAAIVKRKAAVVKEKLSHVLKTIESIKEVPEPGSSAGHLPLFKKESEGRVSSEKMFYNTFYPRSFDNFSPAIDDQKTNAGSMRGTFRQRTLDNKKKFIELKGDQKKNFHLTQSSTGKTWFGKSELGLGSYKSVQGLEKIKSPKPTDSFNMSVKQICGDVSHLLENNKSLNIEVKKSQAQAEKYYVEKAKYVANEDIPESLMLPKKPNNLNKKATFIMELTRKLLKQ